MRFLALLIVACDPSTDKSVLETGLTDDSDAPLDTQETAEPRDSAETGKPLPELPDHVYEISGLDTDLPHDDLAPLSDIIGEARWVGLGESVHTSGGYYQAKFRLFTWLVEEKGFRAFGFETPWDDALAASDYVATGEGSAEDGVHSLFGVWQDTAVLDLLTWMRAWNLAHPDDPVHFFGWDIQQPWDDGARLLQFLERAAPDDAATLYAGIDVCNGVGAEDVYDYYTSDEADELSTGIDEETYAACVEGLDTLSAYMTAQEAALVGATTQDDYDWAWISLVGIRAWEGEAYAYATDIAASYEAREVGNTYVIQEMQRLSFPDAKVVVWAHNSHISTGNSLVHGYRNNTDTTYSWQGWTSMGEMLETALGDDYAQIGLVGYDVDINWGSYSDPMVPGNARSVENILHGYGRDYLLVDLEPEAGGSLFEFEGEYQVTMEWMVPSQQWDGLLFLDYSWPMTYVE